MGSIILTWIFFSIAFLIAKKVDKLSIIDSFWSLSFMVIAIYSWFVGSQNLIGNIITVLVLIWGIRLASHISFRNLGKEEDYRYQQMREKWDHVWLTAYFKVFLVQGLLMLSIGFPIILINGWEGSGINIFVYIGLLIWLIGYAFEVIGDLQLKNFLKKREDPKQVMTKGLWAYTRHPNYFGEVTMWWGIFVIVFSVTGWWYTIISPLMITFLILKVSGVPLLEEKYNGRPSFEEYKKHTNKFFPWFRK
jgi:steroid 5-alpha reductase family enzyme